MPMNIIDHLYNRRLDRALHCAWVDEEEMVVSFPLWNLSGQMVGYQQYRPDVTNKRCNDPKESRYFTYRNKNTISVWGLESWRKSNTLFVTEGIFDASALTWNGASAIALVSNDPNVSTRAWMRTVRQMRRVVAVCDDDRAGRKLAKTGHYSHVVSGGDLGDQPNEYVKNLIEEYG